MVPFMYSFLQLKLEELNLMTLERPHIINVILLSILLLHSLNGTDVLAFHNVEPSTVQLYLVCVGIFFVICHK